MEDNLLVTSTMRVKVADFGTACLADISRNVHGNSAGTGSKALQESKISSRSNNSMTAKLGTPAYMAPEMIAGRPYDMSVDVYSFGEFCCRSILRLRHCDVGSTHTARSLGTPPRRCQFYSCTSGCVRTQRKTARAQRLPTLLSQPSLCDVGNRAVGASKFPGHSGQRLLAECGPATHVR